MEGKSGRSSSAVLMLQSIQQVFLLCRNFQVQRHGGIENRAGTIYCGNSQNQSAACRLRPFMYDSYHGYLLEIQAGLMRVWANGAPLTAMGCPPFNVGSYAPPGSIVSSAGSYYYCVSEQWQGAPITLTITGSYSGGQITITASASLFTADMAWTGGQIRFRVPGGQIVTVTLNHYTSATVVVGTADIPVPVYLQATATLAWILTCQTFVVQSYQTGVNIPITMELTTATSFAAGQPISIGANYPFFSQEMATANIIMTFPSALGPVNLTMSGYVSGVALAGTCNIDIPTALQNTPTTVWSTPQTLSNETISPAGPNDPSGIFAFPASAPTITVSTATGFLPTNTVTLTASASVFTAGQAAAGQSFVLHDGLGNLARFIATTYSSGTVMLAQPITSVPVSLQNVATTNWSTANHVPAINSPYWYKLTSNVIEIPTQVPQAALGSLVTSQYNNTMTFAQQAFAPFQLTRSNQYQWALTNVASSCGIAAPTPIFCIIGSSSTLHLFEYFITAVNALGEESLISNPTNCLGNYPSPSVPNVITWTPVVGAVSYNVYGTVSASNDFSVPGLLGSTTLLSFNDVGNPANVAIQPPAVIPLFQTTSDYPAVTSYFQQRLIFANTALHPQRCWMSQTANFLNFTIITPTSAAGAIEFDIPGQQIQPISAIVDIGKLVLHTASAEYICTGDASGAITPTTINVVRQGTSGGALVQPVVIGVTDLYVQARGGQIRDLIYTIQSVSYSGKDLTIFSPEMFSDSRSRT